MSKTESEFAKFNEQEKEDYKKFFDHYEDMNSNDPASSHLEAIDAVIALR